MDTEKYDDLFIVQIEQDGYTMNAISIGDLKSFLQIGDSEFEVELYKAMDGKGYRAKVLGKLLESEIDDIWYIPALALALIIEHLSSYKKYQHLSEHLPYIKMICYDDFFRYFLSKEVKKAKRKVNANVESAPKSLEDLLAFKDKKIPKEFRTPDLLSVQNKSNPLFGKSIVVTGNFQRWPNRAELVSFITEQGGYVKDSISKKTDYVIVGTEAGPSKLKKIEDLKIEHFYEQGFIDLLNTNSQN